MIKMSKPFLRFCDVTFRYDSSSATLFQKICLHISSGWSGVVGANGTGKTTFLKLATGLLEPNEGRVESMAKSVYCEQRTDDIPDKLAQLIGTSNKSACLIRNRLGIQDDWVVRWETLSHGERKRAQIAVAFWLKPSVLAIDEPTNHIDSQARDIIITALSGFKGIGLLVSHDRELLDSLCHQCLFVEPPEVIVRPGGITKAAAIAKAEQEFIKKQLSQRKRKYKSLKKEFIKRRELAGQARKKVSKRRLAKKDSDGREKLDMARLSGKDGVGGKVQRQIHRRMERAGQKLAKIKVEKEKTLGIWVPGYCSKRNTLLTLKAGMLPLGGERKLSFPELVICPKDRIAVTGPNGSGKSTLVHHLVKSLKLPLEHITYVPQEICLNESRRILTQAQTLSGDKLGHLMNIVSRLGSDPERLLDSNAPSPGETRKLLLAIGVTCKPHIIIMDEPTNHMDLPSIQCLEDALSDCPCSLVLVSHDKYFLGKVTQKSWNITKDINSPEISTLQIE
jgi:ATPase subunit of ABC transporter with duplicated ATPase domains